MDQKFFFEQNTNINNFLQADSEQRINQDDV